MARIVPKLNLNKTPQIVENHSLIFAKNIKVMKDGSIIRDDGIIDINIGVYASTEQEVESYCNNSPNSFVAKYYEYRARQTGSAAVSQSVAITFDDEEVEQQSLDVESADDVDYTDVYKFHIVGVISYNTEFYVLLYNKYFMDSKIFLYDEKNQNNNKIIECAWHYSGGANYTTQLKGYVTINLRNEKLLTIVEYGDDSLYIPLKTINIEKATDKDLESWYTQAPEIPLTNLYFNSYYDNVIPNGTYQFFVRYELKKDLYSKWFPASKELMSGTIKSIDSIHGSFAYIDDKIDSSESFCFLVDHINKNILNKVKTFQIGFILAHDDEVVARSWKKFDINTDKIYFDYDKSYIEEVDINDMLESVYDLYNVHNIANFKNKLYISNYLETDLNNALLQPISKNIQATLQAYTGTETIYFKGYAAKDKTYIQDTNINIFSKNTNNDEIRSVLDVDTRAIASYDTTSPARTFILRNLGGIWNTIYNKIQQDTGHSPSFDQVYNELYDYIIQEYYNQVGNSFVSEGDVTATVTYNGNSVDIFLPFTHNKAINAFASDTYNIDFTDLIAYLRTLDIWYCIENHTLCDSNGNTINNGLDANNILKVELQLNLNYYVAEGINNIYFLQGNYNEYLYRVGDAPEEGTNFRDFFDTALDENVINIKFGEVGVTYDYSQTGCITLKPITDYISTARTDISKDSQTLLPLKEYNFYIHYITKKGEITNGYPITVNNSIYPFADALFDNTRPKVIYPVFSNIVRPNVNYIACFFSVKSTKNKIIHLKYSGEIDNYVIYDCIDIDTLTMPISNNIYAFFTSDNTNISKDNADLTNGFYVSSGETNKDYLKLFGSSGKVVFVKPTGATIPETTAMGVMFGEDYSTDNYIKCTPYISLLTGFDSNLTKTYSEFLDDNLLGYRCEIVKPTVNEFTKYISGSDVYTKTIDSNYNIKLDLDNTITTYNIKHTDPYYIYSEYNIRMLTLTSNLNNKIKTITDNTTPTKVLFTSLESLTLSDCYTFPSMYKAYTRKLYNKIDEEAVTQFDNTIRASIPLSPEIKQYIYEFEADKYYNVPTNKGMITNLISVLDKIIVHTQDSLFQFTGSTKLQTNDGQTQLNENDPFETGISEIYGSEHGFAGLQDNSNSMLVYDGYIFFDKDAKTGYNYHGQGLIPITAPIEKLINYNDISSIKFANDYFNDRFFMLLTFNNGVEVNLSFNYVQKTFVSLHDFTFDKSFSTKNNCYFIKGDYIYKVDREGSIYGDLNYIVNAQHQSIFPTIVLADSTTRKSIVDVICNDAFELIKTLDSISWIGSKVQHIYNTVNNINSDDACMAEESTRNKNFVDYIQIYSDTCRINLTDIKDKDAKDSISDFSSPIYNDGLWSWNYFRNVKTLTKNGVPLPDKTDNRSNIYGKYFVVRFVFDNDTYTENQITKMNDFKLENVIFNFVK